jgi:hypothetical protein
MSQLGQLEALADHRGGLEGAAVQRRQAIHARQHQALQRCGKRFLAPLVFAEAVARVRTTTLTERVRRTMAILSK